MADDGSDGTVKQSVIIMAGAEPVEVTRQSRKGRGTVKDSAAPESGLSDDAAHEPVVGAVYSPLDDAEEYAVESENPRRTYADDIDAYTALLVDIIPEDTGRIRTAQNGLETVIKSVVEREHIPLDERHTNMYRRLSDVMYRCTLEALDNECMPPIDRLVVLKHAGTEFAMIQAKHYMTRKGAVPSLVKHVKSELGSRPVREDVIQSIARYNARVNPESIYGYESPNDKENGQSLAIFLTKDVGEFILLQEREILGVYCCGHKAVAKLVDYALEAAQEEKPIEFSSVKILGDTLYLVRYAEESKT